MNFNVFQRLRQIGEACQKKLSPDAPAISESTRNELYMLSIIEKYGAALDSIAQETGTPYSRIAIEALKYDPEKS